MSSSDNQVEIRITGSLDSSVKASTAEAAAAYQGLGDQVNVSSAAMSAALKATGGDLSKITPEMLGAGTAAEQMGAKMAETAAASTAAKAALDGVTISTSRVSREAVVLARELAAGNYSRIPGSLIVMGEAFNGVSLSMLATVGAAAAMTAGLVYVEYEALKAQKELDNLTEGFKLTGRGAQASSDDIKYEIDFLAQLPGVTRAAADGFEQFVATHANVSTVLANEVGQLLPAFVDMYGKKAPEAAGQLALALSDLTENGFRKLDSELLNLSPAEYETILNLIKIGDTAAATKRILDDLSKQSGVYIKSLGDQVYDLEQKIKQTKDVIEAEKFFGDPSSDIARLQALETALANIRKQESTQAQQGKDNEYKRQLDDAEKVNDSLDRQGKITQQITVFQKDLNDARTRGDQAGIATFTAAIANEQAKQTQLQTEANEKVYRDFVAKEEAKSSAFKTGSEQRIQAAQAEVAEAAKLFGTESSQYSEAVKRLNSEKLTATKAANDQILQSDRQVVEAARQGSAERITAAQKEVTDAIRLYGQESSQATSAEAALTAATRAQIAERRQIRAQDLDSDLSISTMRLEAQKQELDEEVTEHRITADQKYQILADLTRKEAQLNVQRLQDEMQTGNLSVAEYNDHANKIKQIWARLDLDLAKLSRQAAQQDAQIWNQAVKSIESTFNSSLNGMLTGTMTWQQGIGGILQGVAEAFLTAGEQIAENWLETQITNLLVTKTTSDVSAIGQITSAAAVAAANAFASTAAIPIVGPELAPAAAAAAFAETMAWTAAASFDVGTSYVPRNMMANVHAGEIIVPRTFSDDIRAGNITLGGQGAGQSSGDGGFRPTFNINAINARGVEAVLKDRRLQRNMAKAYGRHMAMNPSSRGAY